MPTNIPDGIIEAIRQFSGGVDHRFADSTGYDLLFEVCRFDFATQYPSRLGEGFIEVHHLSPLSTQDEPRRPTSRLCELPPDDPSNERCGRESGGVTRALRANRRN